MYKAYIGVYRGFLAYTGSAAHTPSSVFRACLFVLLFLVGSFRRGFGVVGLRNSSLAMGSDIQALVVDRREKG